MGCSRYVGGHMIGGTVWKIVKETDEILYAVDYNHKKERHLNPTVLETLNRPTLLITDAFNGLTTQTSRRSRDMDLIGMTLIFDISTVLIISVAWSEMTTDTTMKTLRGDGNVLLPTDTAGRVLELLLTLDQHWAYELLLYDRCIMLLTVI